ncbi:MAG TPA: hypothetical protein VES90_12215 [Candidatus Eisenbacteria bacterium]|nr:hypothetical protein [Candidatus Eisenbacteria bacterium]
MAVNPALFGFSAEYRGDRRVYDGFDEYLRVEFPKRHPGWEPRFGEADTFDEAKNRHDYTFLISGDVPHAESQADAEHKVAQLLEEIARGFKGARPDIKEIIPKPITKVWRWRG